MQTMEATIAPTKVIYGVNELDLDLAGKSIRGIWKVLEQVLNIPRDAAVSVTGSTTRTSSAPATRSSSRSRRA